MKFELSEVSITWMPNARSEYNHALANDGHATVRRYISSLLQTEVELQIGVEKITIESDSMNWAR